MYQRTMVEVIRDYKNSIERNLAGEMTGKKDADLDDNEVDAAQKIVAKTSDTDYIAIGNALDRDDTTEVKTLIHRYDPTIEFKSMKETDLLDRDMLESAGFTYSASVPSELARKVTAYLDENEIEYLEDGQGSYQLKLGDREAAYKIGRGLNKMLTAGSMVRDSARMESRTKKDQPKVKRHRTGLAGIQKTGAGPHSEAKYTKQDRRGGKHRKDFNSGDE